MKKLVIAIGLGLMAGSVYAACLGGGAICYDENGVVINGTNVVNDSGLGLRSRTKSQIITSTPTYVGQMLYCSDCVGGGGVGTICLSTSTSGGLVSGGSYFVLSTGTVCK